LLGITLLHAEETAPETAALEQAAANFVVGYNHQDASAIEMEGNETMHFAPVGAPDGDPGLDFTKKLK